MVLLTMVGMFTTGVWWTSKLDSRLLVVEEWKSEAKPIVAKMDVMELRLDRQYQILQKIDSAVCELQKYVWSREGRKLDKTTYGVSD
jgi:hypothetical protein